MNPFEAHGIDHLSPSSLNLFIRQPGLWARRYLDKQKDPGNFWMWRGNAVEKGYVAYLRSFDVETSYDVAQRAFAEEVAANNAQGPAAEKEALLIETMLDQCLLWTPPSNLNAAQIEIEYWFGNIPVPIKGWVDLAFEGIDVDLKTKLRCPSKPDPEHVRQVSLYRAARNRAGALLYVTDKRRAYFDVTDEMMVQSLADFQDAAVKLFKLLGSFANSADILSVLPINWDDYRAPKRDALKTASASDDFVAVELQT